MFTKFKQWINGDDVALQLRCHRLTLTEAYNIMLIRNLITISSSVAILCIIAIVTISL